MSEKYYGWYYEFGEYGVIWNPRWGRNNVTPQVGDLKDEHTSAITTQWGYGIHDYKTGKLFLIEYISSGRWKFLGKHFNKLDDINEKKAYLINRRYNRGTNDKRV